VGKKKIEWWPKNTFIPFLFSRRRFPFFPQFGDFIVYFQQGHRAYLEEMQKRNFSIPSKYRMQSDLDAQEFCYIDNITYTTIGKSPQMHVAELRLARTKNGKRIGRYFVIW
jgi:hypothetical protein